MGEDKVGWGLKLSGGGGRISESVGGGGSGVGGIMELGEVGIGIGKKEGAKLGVELGGGMRIIRAMFRVVESGEGGL